LEEGGASEKALPDAIMMMMRKLLWVICFVEGFSRWLLSWFRKRGIDLVRVEVDKPARRIIDSIYVYIFLINRKEKRTKKKL
jgi:hypothetical protein